MERMGTEGSLWRQMPVQLPNQVLRAVLLVRQGARGTVKRLFAVLLHRIMAKPELPAIPFEAFLWAADFKSVTL